jgi:putative sugar O-methyltransferase
MNSETLVLTSDSHPFKSLFDLQISLTHRYVNELNRINSKWLGNHPRVKYLTNNYNIPFSLGGGCINFIEINSVKIAAHYLQLLDMHDRTTGTVNYQKANSFFEIGGGFGGNLHLLIENYPNIRKYVYLDVPPNLYVLNQYLKSHFRNSVRDYSEHRGTEISFSENDDLEIFCIAPWQIENLKVDIDIFFNSHSFVEISKDAVQNYANFVERALKKNQGRVVLVSYTDFDPNTTPHPDTLPENFSMPFSKYEYQDLSERTVYNYYISAP